MKSNLIIAVYLLSLTFEVTLLSPHGFCLHVIPSASHLRENEFVFYVLSSAVPKKKSWYIISDYLHNDHSQHTSTEQQIKLLPAQHPQNEIENEKRAEDDERDKIDPWQLIAHSILHLRERRGREEVEEKKGGKLKVKTKKKWWKEGEISIR